jgi:hypothetical protein
MLLTNAILSDADDFRIPQPRGGVSEPATQKTFRIEINLDTFPHSSIKRTKIMSPDVSTPKAFGAGKPLNANPVARI